MQTSIKAMVAAAVSCGLMLMPLLAAASTLHYTTNVKDNIAPAVEDGFNVFDISGSAEFPEKVAEKVNALPEGAMALIWVGNMGKTHSGTCDRSGFTTTQFHAQVDALADNPRVYGYYLADEPHPLDCPRVVAEISARADYIHTHTNQKAFILVLDGYNLCHGKYGCEYKALAPAATHVDLIGLDPYPCHYKDGKAAPCDISSIKARVDSAISNGIPADIIVPTFQTFGQEGRNDGGKMYYRTPKPEELEKMLAAWKEAIPHPVMDYSYTYGTQCTKRCPSPQALINHDELRSVIKAHNAEK